MLDTPLDRTLSKKQMLHLLSSLLPQRLYGVGELGNKFHLGPSSIRTQAKKRGILRMDVGLHVILGSEAVPLLEVLIRRAYLALDKNNKALLIRRFLLTLHPDEIYPLGAVASRFKLGSNLRKAAQCKGWLIKDDRGRIALKGRDLIVVLEDKVKRMEYLQKNPHKTHPRTLTKEEILKDSKTLDPDQIFNVNAITKRFEVQRHHVLVKARRIGVLIENPEGHPFNFGIRGKDATRVIELLVNNFKIPRIVEPFRDRIAPLPPVITPKKKGCVNTPGQNLKRALTKKEMLRRINVLNPEHFYSLSELAYFFQISHAVLREGAEGRGCLHNHPTRHWRNKPTLILKGADAIAIIHTLEDAPPTKRPKGLYRKATPVRVDPAPVRVDPVPVRVDLTAGIEVYARLEKDLSQYPVVLASGVVAALSKKFQSQPTV